VVVKYRTDLMTNAGVERKNSTDDAAHALWCFENSTEDVGGARDQS